MENEIKKFSIEYLLHFTKIENLSNIFLHGLLPRAALQNRRIEFQYNDDYRIDGYENAICVSIGFPNYKLFYSFRKRDENQKWVILALHPNILIDKDCAFCHTNAASNEVTSIPIEQRKGKGALRRLFDDIEGKPSRASLGIKSPTNPQAEVLVFDAIEPHYIGAVITETEEIENHLGQSFPKYKQFFCNNKNFFKPRSDYTHWQ